MRRKRSRHRRGWSTPAPGKRSRGCSAREPSRACHPRAAARRPRAARLPGPPGTGPGSTNTIARRASTRAARTPLDRRTACVEGGQPGRRPAREDERHAQAGEYLGLALGRAGAAGLAQRLAQFTDPGLDVAEVAQHDPRGLMSHRGVMRARPSGEHGTRSGSAQPRAGTWPARPNRPPRADLPRPRPLPRTIGRF